MIRIVRMALALGIPLLATIASAADSARVPPDLVPEKYRVAERHSFNLGAESGSYTDWHRYDLPTFDGLATVVEVPLIYGKPKDKWAAIVKVRFFADGQTEEAAFALVFMADRKTKRIHALLERGEDLSRLGVDFGLKERVPLIVTRMAPDRLDVRIAGTRVEIPAPSRIDGIALVGSGLDVTFEPFTLLGKAE